MADYTIREVKNQDVESVEEIAVRAFSVHYDYYRETMGDRIFNHVHKDWQVKKKKAVRDACNFSNGTTVYVAEKEGIIIGFVTVTIDKDRLTGVIGNNSVDLAFQGQGIGKSLYDHALEIMRQAGMQCAKVDTGLGSTYSPARRAYEKAGFDKQLWTVSYFMEL